MGNPDEDRCLPFEPWKAEQCPPLTGLDPHPTLLPDTDTTSSASTPVLPCVLSQTAGQGLGAEHTDLVLISSLLLLCHWSQS